MKKNSIVGGAGLVLILLNGCGSDDGALQGPNASDSDNSVVPRVAVPTPAEALPSVGLPNPIPPYIPPPVPVPAPAAPGQWGVGKQIGFGKPALPLPLPVPPPIPVPPPYDIGKPPFGGPGFGGGFGGPGFGGPGFGGPGVGVPGALPAATPPAAAPAAPAAPLSEDHRILNGRYSLVSARCSNRRSFPVSLDVSYSFNNATSGLVRVEEGPRNLRQIPLKLNYHGTDQIGAEPDLSALDTQEQKRVNRFAFRGTPELNGNSLRIRGSFSPDLYNCGSEDSPEAAVEMELHSLGERDSQ